MTTLSDKYKLGHIYIIYYNDINYKGSTFQRLQHLFNTHKAKYIYNQKHPGSPKSTNCMIYEYFKKYGIDAFKIKLVKSYYVVDVKHLKMYETLWMNKIKCVNKYNAIKFLLSKHYNKMKGLEWSKNNRSKCREKQKRYDLRHPEKRRERNKRYRENNKEKSKEYHKNYSKTYNIEIVFCHVCKIQFQKRNFKHHNSTKRHVNKLLKLNNL